MACVPPQREAVPAAERGDCRDGAIPSAGWCRDDCSRLRLDLQPQAGPLPVSVAQAKNPGVWGNAPGCPRTRRISP
ncbi:MAG: hypothetical protein RLZZ373_3363 [Pseudomonadota bacterium]